MSEQLALIHLPGENMTKTALILLAVAACGGSASDGASDFDIPPGDDPGEGSLTLRVSGIVETTELASPALDPTDFNSSFTVSVTLDDEEVRDAIVTISSIGGTKELVFETSGTIGSYQGSQLGYFSRYRLDVDAGDDFVGGVIIEAPDVHQIEAPLSGERVPRGDDLVVQWTRNGAAEKTEIETREIDRRSIEDTGSYTVDAGDLRQDPDKVEDERIRIYRSTKIVPDGAVAGSEFEVRLRNSVEFLVEP